MLHPSSSYWLAYRSCCQELLFHPFIHPSIHDVLHTKPVTYRGLLCCTSFHHLSFWHTETVVKNFFDCNHSSIHSSIHRLLLGLHTETVIENFLCCTSIHQLIFLHTETVTKDFFCCRSIHPRLLLLVLHTEPVTYRELSFVADPSTTYLLAYKDSLPIEKLLLLQPRQAFLCETEITLSTSLFLATRTRFLRCISTTLSLCNKISYLALHTSFRRPFHLLFASPSPYHYLSHSAPHHLHHST